MRSRTSGNRKSFQIGTNRKTTTVATAGRTSGTMIRKNICQVLAPSMRAASSSSGGSCRKNVVRTKIENGTPEAA